VREGRRKASCRGAKLEVEEESSSKVSIQTKVEEVWGQQKGGKRGRTERGFSRAGLAGTIR